MNAMGMDQLTKVAFRATMTPLPFKFKKPSDSQQYGQAFSAVEKFGIPNPMCLFRPESLNGYHVNTAKMIGQQFETYIDGVIAAIGGAVDQWAKLATIVNAKVMAVSCIGQAGCLKAPPIEPLIFKDAPKKTQQEQKYSKAIAKGVGKCWDDWAKNVTIPGLPWYPAFAAFPGPMAPPTPNIPTPLIVLPSTKMSEMTPDKLSKAMVDALGDKKAQHHKVLFDSLGKGIATIFLAWLPTVQVMNVLGTGPIPTFAPPYVPVGPVMNGMANGAPGCLMSPPSGAAALKKPGGSDPSEEQKKQIKQMEQAAKQSEQKAKQELQKLKQESAKRQQEAEAAAKG